MSETFGVLKTELAEALRDPNSRTFTDSNAAGRQLQVMGDTIQYRSDVRPPYRPGQVISSGKGAGGGYRMYRLPTLADFADRSLGIGYPGGATILLVLVLASLFTWYATLGTVAVDSVRSPRSEVFYWVTIMFSQTLGTALGDWTADSLGLGYLGGTVDLVLQRVAQDRRGDSR